MVNGEWSMPARLSHSGGGRLKVGNSLPQFSNFQIFKFSNYQPSTSEVVNGEWSMVNGQCLPD